MSTVSTLPEPEGWTALAEDWQAGRPRAIIDVAALRRRLDTERRRMVIGAVASVVVSFGYIAWPGYQLVRHPGPESVFLAIDSWAALAAAWLFVAWSGRGTWKPLAETTEMFLLLERRRCVARLRAARAALGFVAIQFATVGLWVRFRPSAVAHESAPRVLLLLPAAIAVAVVVMAVRTHRQVPRMVAEVDRLLAELRQ